ncbi:hypothetical protein KUH03_18930 [Sphingobacterium sp. E70]|uniref:hypothetical protein n=1 Tax=Sphingobacterium sp. E70 TaxID=2853439 RepID=UPI00211BD6DF|nr:hypothetical protein [Sphingobacterium sp. E70]ULT28439.1 hypothetical protein KUH03_18930 [Sphingobacterium sp. E70]
MRSLILLFICLGSWTWAFAQTENEEGSNYIMDPAAIEFRTKMTIPPYGLAKVKALIAKLSPVGDKDGEKLVCLLFLQRILRI